MDPWMAAIAWQGIVYTSVSASCGVWFTWKATEQKHLSREWRRFLQKFKWWKKIKRWTCRARYRGKRNIVETCIDYCVGLCDHSGVQSRLKRVPTPGRLRLRVECGRGSPPPAVRVRGITPRKFWKTQMLNAAFW